MEPINTAILSFGMSGQIFHAPFIEVHKGFNFYSVWERSKNLAEERYPKVKTFRSIDEVLNDPNVELVVVNTPNYSHYEYAKKALQAAKNVIVEKPFTVTVKEGEELISLAKQKNKLLTVYQNRRYDSDYKVIKKIVQSGWLGEIVEAEFHYDRYNEQLSPKLHKEIPGPGTGGLYDLGSHLIDQALQLFGKPVSIFADFRILRPLSKVPDYFEILFYYPRLRVRLHSSYIVREPLPAYAVHGTKGSFIKSKTDVQEAALIAGKIPGGPDWGKEPESEKGFLHTERDGKIVKEHIASEAGNYLDYYEGVFQTLRNNKPAPVSAEDGLDVIRIIEAAIKSSAEKKIVDL
jgi:scyllo-inositol 2-dehydrogenase (NADP+)